MPDLDRPEGRHAVPHHEHALRLLASGRLSLVRVHGREFSLGTRSWSRTVSAMIGMLSALLRVSVTIRAVQLRSGRMSRGGSVERDLDVEVHRPVVRARRGLRSR